MSQSNWLSPQKDSTTHNDLQIFRQMKEIIQKMNIQNLGNIDNRQETIMEQQIKQSKIINELNQEVMFYKESFLAQQQKIKNIEEQWEKSNKQSQNRHRRQTKKYIELINQKQLELETQKKNNASLLNRISSMTHQIQSINNAKISIQSTIAKSIENLKSQIMECNCSIDENDLDKIVLQNKYKLICDKAEQVSKQFNESEIRRKNIENKYENLKKSHQQLQSQCMDLKFQVQKYRMKTYDAKRYESLQNHSIMDNNNDHSNENLKQIFGKMETAITIFTQIQQCSPTLQTVQQLKKLINDLETQNMELKNLIASQQLIIQQFQIKQNGDYQNQILQKRNPSLYQCLLKKKQQIQYFQNKLMQVQLIAKEIQQSNFQQRQKQAEKVSQYEIQSLKMKIEELEANLQRSRKQNEEIDSQRRTYKLQLFEMVNLYQKKLKKGGKTKKKQRCDVCFLDIQHERNIATCEGCQKKIHPKCLCQHQCLQKIERQSNCSDFQIL